MLPFKMLTIVPYDSKCLDLKCLFDYCLSLHLKCLQFKMFTIQNAYI